MSKDIKDAITLIIVILTTFWTFGLTGIALIKIGEWAL